MKTKTKTKKSQRCKCIAAVNEQLEPHNTELATEMSISFETGEATFVLPVPTRKCDSDKKGKVKTVFGSYCPFCGKKYPE